MHVLIAWLGMGFSIAFTYPLVFNSAREVDHLRVVVIPSAIKQIRRPWLRYGTV